MLSSNMSKQHEMKFKEQWLVLPNMRGRNFLTAGMCCTTSRGSIFVPAGDIVGHNE